MRVSASGMFCSFQVSLVMASHSRARGAVQGRSSGRVAASASMRPMSAATSPMLGNGASGELAGNGVRCPSQLRMRLTLVVGLERPHADGPGAGQQAVLRRADPLPAHLGDLTAADAGVEGPATDAAAGLEHGDGAPAGDEVGRGRQAAEARPDDDDVDAAAAPRARGARRPGRAERRPGHERRAARDRLPARQRPVVAHPCSSRRGPCRRHPSMQRRATATGPGAARASATLAAAMEHTAEGYWVQEAGRPSPAPRLRGTTTADVAVVGGGYLGPLDGVARAAPRPRRAGGRARGRRLRDGPVGAQRRLRQRAVGQGPDRPGPGRPRRGAPTCSTPPQASVDAIGAWCDEQGVDAWFRRAAHLEVATSRGPGGAVTTASSPLRGGGPRRRGACR